MFEGIKDQIRGSRPTLSLTGDRFAPIDKDKVIRDLKIERTAKADGKQNSPSSNSGDVSQTERGIEAELVGYQTIYANSYGGYLQTYKSDYREACNDLNFDRIQNEEDVLVGEAEQQAIRMEGELKRSANRLVAHAKQLLLYRKTHGLMDRLPDLRDGYGMLTLIVLALVLEVGVTFFLTREAGSSLTVFTVVALYCVLNIATPLFCARFVKYMFFRPIDIYHRLGVAFGTVVLIFLFGLFLVLNLGMGHYRSAGLTFDVEQSDTVSSILENFSRQQELILLAWQKFVTDPLGLNEILSWLLVVFGVFLAVVALYEGVTWDDKYPRYGKLSKKFTDAHRKYQDAIEEHIDEINFIREDAVEDINGSKHKFRRALLSVPEIVSKSEALYDEFIEANRKLDRDYKALISLYRQTNAQNRTDEPPRYFNDITSLEVPSVEKYSPERVDEKIDEQEVISFIDGTARRIHERIDRLTSGLPSVESVLKEVGDPLIIEENHD